MVDAAALIVEHHTDAPKRSTRDDHIAGVQSAVLNEDGGDRSAAAVELCLDDGAAGETVGIGGKLLCFRNQQDHLQQRFNSFSALGRDGNADDIAAPFLRDQLIFGQLLLDLLRIGSRLIDLVDGDDNLNAGGLGVVDRLDGLRHDAVVGSNDQYRDVGDLRAARPHRGEGGVSRRVEEGDRLIVDLHLIGADVLGDAARLGGGDVGLADGIEQGGLAMIDVAHDHDDRGAGSEMIIVILGSVKELFFKGDDNLMLDLRADLHGDESGSVIIDDLRNRGHDAYPHQTLDDLSSLDLQAKGQFADGQLVGKLNLELLPALPFKLKSAHLLHFLFAAGTDRLAALLPPGELLLGWTLGLGGKIDRSNLLIFFVVLIEVDLR